MKNYYNVPLSNKTKEIILGSLLGDGSLKIHKPYKNARFSFRHSIKQKSYFEWKEKQLEEISSENSSWLQKEDGFSRYPKLRYQSRALEALTELYNITYKKGRLSVKRSWLNCLTALSLAIWWLDDGSIISNGRKGVICTEGFDKKSLEILSKYLKVVWKVETKIGSVKKLNGKKEEYYRLWFRSTEELKKLLGIILPYIKVEEMLPKVILLYKDDQHQQRWISEITQKTNFSLETVEKYKDLKKNKWEIYRK